MKDDNKQLYNFKYQIRTPNKKLLIGELIQKNGVFFYSLNVEARQI